MENSMTITKTRNDAKLILKGMPKALQAACDKIFIAGADFAGAIVNTNEQDSVFRLALLEASNTYGKPENSEFKGFGDFACAVFGFTSASAVTNAVKVAEHIDLEKIPKLSSWYSTGMLYELRDVSADILREDIKSGALHAGMTQKELRAYNASHQMDDGKADVVKMYNAYIQFSDGISKTCTYEELLDTMRMLCRENLGLNTETIIETDRFGSYNPHVTITPDKGKPKDAKGIFLAYGRFNLTAWYYPAERSKTRKKPENSSQNVVQDLLKLSPEERAQILKMLSGGEYEPEEDDE